MVKKWSCLLSISLLLGFTYSSNAQTKLFEVEVGEVAALDIDRMGQIYIVDHEGNVMQYKDDQEIRRYSPTVPAEVQIDAWAMLNTVVFSPDWQGVRILGQQLTQQSEYLFDENLIEYATIATNATDAGIWLYDQPAFRIKKYFPNQQQISIDVSIEQILSTSYWNPTWIREYQNNLYIVEERMGVFTFDLLGNILSEPVDIGGAKVIGLTDDKMYWLKKDQLHFKSLYSTDRETLDLPTKKATFAVYDTSLNRVYCIVKNKLIAYQMQ
ncbi:hypothetical protein [Flammeovirga pacifica]|uniref:Glutamine cyclotransferase n=1 Tax=Flammeovirga pacifica TaxID=915059 RepID=A0A1S1Z4T1_FLAPC|nr:hypothetical protein [Flammeovirga pacifica]OHX68298.1 hypothetical protein NH26_19075 [Flammeovirga pacifica]